MKPLLSELFLPCSGMHSPIRANRYPLATITGAQRASGQTHSRARSHQDDADLRADRSTAYLVSCIRVRSAHGNSFVLERSPQQTELPLHRVAPVGAGRSVVRLADLVCWAIINAGIARAKTRKSIPGAKDLFLTQPS